MKNIYKFTTALVLLGFIILTSLPPVAIAASVSYPYQGGTGTSTIPAGGNVLVGQTNGTYAPQATSTIGIDQIKGLYQAIGTINAGDAVYAVGTATGTPTFDNTAVVSNAGTTFSQSYTIASQPYKVLVAFMATNGVAPSSAPTYAGTPMTLAVSYTAGSNFYYQYYLVNPTSGANNFTWNTTSSAKVTGRIYSYYNASFDAQSFQSNFTAGPAVSQSVTVATSSSLIVSSVFGYSTSAFPVHSSPANMSNNQTLNQNFSGVGNPPYVDQTSGDSGLVSTNTTVSLTSSGATEGAIFTVRMDPPLPSPCGATPLGNGWVSQAVGSSMLTSYPLIGISTQAISNCGTGPIQVAGLYATSSVYSSGNPVYVSNVAGKTSSTPGSTGVSIGTAVSSSSILISPLNQGISTTRGGVPVPSSCGTTPSLVGNDSDGYINVSGSTAACTVTFSTPKSYLPTCTFDINKIGFTQGITAISATAFTMTVSSSIGTGVYYYHCAIPQP